MNYRALFGWLFTLAVGVSPAVALAQPKDVVKTNPMKVYMHYMPWFDAPYNLGNNQWGYHWKMNNRNPNIVDENGKRQIASHYYPKIGPYASSDPDVIEYHLLLMKLSGVDGVMIDWYGVQGANGDVGQLLTNSNALVDRMDNVGLDFGVVLEDRFSTFSINNTTPDINKAKANVAYLKDHYFNNPSYIRIGSGNEPLLGVFGPIRFQQPSQWTEILAQAGEEVKFLPLWYESGDAGTNADGEYAWIYEDAGQDNHLTHQSNFYRFRAPNLDVAGGMVYPGFNDFYQEGGTGTVIHFDIPHENGQTLDSLIALANQYASRVDFVQLGTFNDFGEGTMFEPTLETGFEYLKKIQQYTGVPYDEDELQLVYQLYVARKKYAGNQDVQTALGQVADLLAELEIDQGRDLLNQIAPQGDFNGDGDVDADDFNGWKAAFGTRLDVYGLGADGNFDGRVDAADYVIWRNQLGTGAAAAAASVPEPSAGVLISLAASSLIFRPWVALARVASDRISRDARGR